MARKTTRARRWFYILFPPLCFLVFAYPLHRLGNWYGTETAIGATPTVLLWLFASTALWYSFSKATMLVRYVMVHWMGASFILLTLTLLYEVVRVIASPDDRIAVPWILGIAVVLVMLSVIAAHFVFVKHLQFHSGKVTRAHRIVQISDVHIGSRQGGYLTRIVNRINQLQPDVVAITGDLVDSSTVGYDELNCLKRLRARTLFCIGNHERYADLDKVINLLTELGVESLRQRQVSTGELQFIGIDDSDERNQVASKLPSIQRHSDQYTVLLYHRPQGWEAAMEHGVDLMLSGHTHNGQIFPFNLLVKRQFSRISGLYTNSAGNAHLYVSPGTGTWGPLMRLGSFNEITCIDIKPMPRASSIG